MKNCIPGIPIPKFLLFIMRMTFLLFVVGVFQIYAIDSYAQKTQLTIHENEIELGELLKRIEKQTDFYFFYSNDKINKHQKVTIDVKDKTISEVLDIVLSNTGITYQVNNKAIILSFHNISTDQIEQQTRRQVKGTVIDANGEPIIGANVIEKGTTNGVITAHDGSFLFLVPPDATLQISYIGYLNQEVVVGDQNNIRVILIEDNLLLEEFVVVGYGIQKKVNVTGAVAAVTIDEKTSSRSLTNVSSGLAGLVPGMAVSQSTGMAGRNKAALLIRGLGTVNNASPLVVVDGTPDVDINRINMHDIESVSVLKDATSASVYGSRAANGVILITTKSGKGQEKASISYTGSYAVQKPTNVYGYMPDYPRALTLHQRFALVNTIRSNLLFRDGTIDQWMALGKIAPIRYPNTDWWNIIVRNGAVQTHNFSALGANDRSNFFISIGIMDEKGLQINNDFSRYNARFNFDYKINNSMNVGVKFQGNWSKEVYALEDGLTAANGGGDLQFAIAGILPYDPVTGYFGGVMAYNEDPQAYNPYTVFTNNLNRANRQEANGNIYWDWTPVKGLTARVDYSLNYYNQFRYTANMPNRAYNFQEGRFGSRIYVGENEGVGNFTYSGYKTMLNGQLSYNTILAGDHELGAMAVYSEEFWYDRYQASSRNNRLHPSLHEIDAALTDIQSTGGNSSTEGLRSLIGRLNYAAFQRYLLELNFRYDGSSKFLPGSQYGFFPSAAVAWRFTEEDFIRNFTHKFMTSGKLRASYGILGNNSGVERYEQQETLATNNYMIDGSIVKGFVNRKMVNRKLSWETTSVFNLGLDLSFFRQRLTAEIDYYDRLTTGMNRPSEMSIHLTSAYTAPRRNIGDLRNRGIELNLTWRDRIGQVDYMINVNGSHNATRLELWNEFLSRGPVFLGMPYQFVYGYKDIGIAQTWEDVYNAAPQGASPGDILRRDINGDGRIDDNDKVAYPRLQRNRPTTNFALNSGFSWKGVDLTILIQGAAGRKDFWINKYNNVNFGVQRYASTWAHWENPWSYDNRAGAWPRLGGNANQEETSFWLDNLSYIRFKNVQLGYTIPKGLLRKIGLSHARIFGSSENLFTITRFRGLDPEKEGHASDAYPLVKSFSFGININI